MKMLRASILSAAALIAAQSAGAKQAAPWPTGIFSDVRMSEQTGDLGGMEARFYEEAGKHMVEFVWCEGWCNETHKAELTREGNSFRFQYVERYTGDGDWVKTNMSYVIRPIGRNKINIVAYQDGRTVDEEYGAHELKRVRKPFGISVANSNVGNEN